MYGVSGREREGREVERRVGGRRGTTIPALVRGLGQEVVSGCSQKY